MFDIWCRFAFGVHCYPFMSASQVASFRLSLQVVKLLVLRFWVQYIQRELCSSILSSLQSSFIPLNRLINFGVGLSQPVYALVSNMSGIKLSTSYARDQRGACVYKNQSAPRPHCAVSKVLISDNHREKNKRSRILDPMPPTADGLNNLYISIHLCPFYSPRANPPHWKRTL